MGFEDLKRQLKGGRGSGNWGHAGRPGKLGGSAPRSGVGAAMSIRTGRTAAERQAQAKVKPLRGEVGSYKDVKAAFMGKAYIVTGDDRIMDVQASVGRREHMDAMIKDPEPYGLTAENADGLRDGRSDTWATVFDSGAILVRELHGSARITTQKVDKPTYRRLQKLYDQDKLGLPPNAINIWEGETGDYSEFSSEDFIDNKRLVSVGDEGQFVLKEQDNLSPLALFLEKRRKAKRSKGIH